MTPDDTLRGAIRYITDGRRKVLSSIHSLYVDIPTQIFSFLPSSIAPDERHHSISSLPADVAAAPINILVHWKVRPSPYPRAAEMGMTTAWPNQSAPAQGWRADMGQG